MDVRGPTRDDDAAQMPCMRQFSMPQKQKPGGEIILAGPVETKQISFGSLLLLLLLLLILLRQIRFRRIGQYAGTGPLIAGEERHKRRDFEGHFLAR
jgi:hypothetical protein